MVAGSSLVGPQPGIFALGNTEHVFLEFDLAGGSLDDLRALLSAVSGINTVVGLRPVENGVEPFSEIKGPSVTMPATQHDAWLWLAASRRDVVFDTAVSVIESVSGVATVASELSGWVYHHNRDLTGFIDGTENPPIAEAPSVAVASDGSSVLLYQKWKHLPSWRSLTATEQERVIGRTRPDSLELDPLPEDSHVARNVVEEHGDELAIFRRNVAYGTPTDHGTVFVGFCAQQHPLDIMLRRMAGATPDGIADALTRYSTALSGAYYVIPPLQ